MPSIRTARTGLALHDETIPACLASADGRRPRWLLTPYASDTWRVTDTGHKPSRSLRFDIALPGGRRLGDHPNLLDTVKRIVFGIRHGPLLRVESGSVQAEKASSLLVLARWMVVNRIERFEDLNASDQWEYAQLAAGGIHDILNTEGTLYELAIPYQSRDALDEMIAALLDDMYRIAEDNQCLLEASFHERATDSHWD